MATKYVLALLHTMLCLSTSVAIASYLTFRGGLPVYGPSFSATILVAALAFSAIGFGWSALALWTNRTGRGFELATWIGVSGQTIGVIDAAIATEGGVTAAVSVVSVVAVSALLSNFCVAERTILPGGLVSAVDRPLEALRERNRKPTSAIGHTGWYLGEVLAWWVLVTSVWLVGYLLFIDPLFHQPPGVHRGVSVVRLGAGVAITLGSILGGVLGSIWLLFRRSTLARRGRAEIARERDAVS